MQIDTNRHVGHDPCQPFLDPRADGDDVLRRQRRDPQRESRDPVVPHQMRRRVHAAAADIGHVDQIDRRTPCTDGQPAQRKIRRLQRRRLDPQPRAVPGQRAGRRNRIEATKRIKDRRGRHTHSCQCRLIGLHEHGLLRQTKQLGPGNTIDTQHLAAQMGGDLVQRGVRKSGRCHGIVDAIDVAETVVDPGR